MLDLATVGPAARASRWLADYGATVVKVGAPPRAGRRADRAALLRLQRPPRHAAAPARPEGGRGARRLPAPRRAEADVVIESFRPGVVDRLGIGYDDVRARQPRHRLLLDHRLRPGRPRRQWAGHDLNYLAVGGYLDCTGPGADGRARRSRGHDRRLRGRRHARRHDDPGRARAARRTGDGAYLDVSVADGVLALMSLYVDEYLATGEIPGPRHDLLTGRYACYDVYEAATAGGCRWPPSSRSSSPTCCQALGLRGVARPPDRRRPPRRDPATSARPSPRGTGTTGWPSWVPADTCVAAVRRSPRSSTTTVRRPGHVQVGETPRAGRVPPGRPVLAGQERRRAGTRCATPTRPTPTSSCPRSGFPGRRSNDAMRTRSVPHERPRRGLAGGSTRSATRSPASSRSSGATSGRPAPRSRTATRCSGTTKSPTRSPTARSPAAVDALGVVPPPPLGAGAHRAAPAPAGPLRPQGALGLPEAVMSDNTITFDDPVRFRAT